jgi:parallel beta-helix repeat protein
VIEDLSIRLIPFHGVFFTWRLPVLGRDIVKSVILLLLFCVVFEASSPMLRGRRDAAKSESVTVTYIRADGSVDPQDAPILSLDNSTYVFAEDMNGSIVVERDNIVLDGTGHFVQVVGVYAAIGVDVHERINVTVENTEIRGFYYGICLNASLQSSLVGNTVASNYWYGLRLECSSESTLSTNNITENGEALYMSCSTNITFRENRMFNNTHSFFVDGYAPAHFLNDVDASNTVDGKPIYYWINKTEMSIPLDAGCVALVNCTQIDVQHLDLSRNGCVLLVYTANSTISDSNITHSTCGVVMVGSTNNSIHDNNIAQNDNGFWITRSSSCNQILGNSVTACTRGSFFYDSSNNQIYHNAFDNNTIQVQDASSLDPDVTPSTNVWDNGYASGGNQWSDYVGTDLHSGPYQNETGSDCIGDAPHVIDENNCDHYPHVVHDVAIVNVVCLKTAIGQGCSASINVITVNQGDVDETLNVSVYADATLVQTQSLTLKKGQSAVCLFAWNTTGLAKGTFTLSAYVWTVAGEADVFDNTLVDGVAHVGVPGDVDGSRAVNMLDLYLIALSFGKSAPYSTPLIANCDIDNNGIVNMLDMYIAAVRFGQTDPL